ncbi:cytochrome C [Parasulfuritortus cantonensis]|uniref:Cytochrome C n=1 Tax=Parasulfuritortus cantonensis TaxID=2528202 RepID=A0A4R1BIN1_9PROT|nr:NAD(P)/FAD-dependent oxidoreductase [Parasulfuritortus cantonensis]TCJ17129.1 cytochrome C [Parasulfuritortus cantonensis]
MSQINRREFIRVLAAGGAASAFPAVARAAAKARVVVIGGGYGGATAAKYLKLLDPAIEVTLIEPNKSYTSCPLSNEVIAGYRDIKTLQVGYDGLRKHGVEVVQDLVTGIDRAARTVTTQGGRKLGYDAMVMSPGVEFHFEGIEGYSEALVDRFPHAWKAGPQTLLLKKQLEAMPDGGKFVIVVPPGPFRCPPGPYERASLVASYLKHHGKTKSKIIIMDANDSHSKKGLFQQAWKKLYGFEKEGLGTHGMIEWVKGAEGGKVVKLDAKTKTVSSDFVDIKADVLNIIPPHKAGKIAVASDLAKADGWCKVVPMTMASAEDEAIYTIGDSCVAGEMALYGNPDANFDMPKSAHIAMTQAKVAAAAIVAKVNGLPAPQPYYANTCYSIVDEGYGFSVAHLYRVENGTFKYIKEGSGISPVKMPDNSEVPALYRKLEAEYADGWLRNVMADAFG